MTQPSYTEDHSVVNTDSSFGFCTICQLILRNPCVFDANFLLEGLPETPPLVPAQVAIVRAQPSSYYLTRAYACRIGRWMARLHMPEREVRNFVTYKIHEGLSQGITYQTPWGEEIFFDPETIDEIFDGRKTAYRSADDLDWSDEISASDRVFGNLKVRAVTGKVRTVPDRRLALRFMLIHLAMQTPSANVHIDD
ncbi:hypothetical protein [uncultured Roseobacter sp.]|uniref:hypothetical protein n=1 Tax=uncultured Roseobacter sp. TaxID=114847 RepID=UPI00261AFF12|nr:hypothetical protein [uncultured Roseobacter sp.]